MSKLNGSLTQDSRTWDACDRREPKQWRAVEMAHWKKLGFKASSTRKQACT